MHAAALQDRVRLDIDDALAVRTKEARMLRVLTRAQEWVAIRFRLLRTTFPVALLAQVPWYFLPTAAPRLVTITHVALAGVPLAPVPLRVLRYTQPNWLTHTGAPCHYYRLGLQYLGLHPYPARSGGHAMVSGCLAPAPLTALTQELEIPDGYIPHVVLAAAALLMIGQEKHEEEAVHRLGQALTLEFPHKPSQQEGHAHAAP